MQPWVDADTGHRYLDYGDQGPQTYMAITGECASRFMLARQYSSDSPAGDSTGSTSSIVDLDDEQQQATGHQEL